MAAILKLKNVIYIAKQNYKTRETFVYEYPALKIWLAHIRQLLSDCKLSLFLQLLGI